jgi:hypothetical protein
MSKDAWKNPDDGVEHPDMDPPINPEHEKIRREKIRRGEPRKDRDRRPAPIEEKKKRVGTHRDAVTDQLTRTRHGAEYKAIGDKNAGKKPKGEQE